jgi:hypothetical protein
VALWQAGANTDLWHGKVYALKLRHVYSPNMGICALRVESAARHMAAAAYRRRLGS